MLKIYIPFSLLYWFMDESEELADLGVGELRDFINTEKRIVEVEHNLIDKLYSWDSIIAHLGEILPEDTELHDSYMDASDKLVEIRDLVESDRLKDLKIEKEEEDILQKIESDIEHKDWKAVKTDLREEVKEEKKVLRLEHHELKEIHSHFHDLMKLMEKNIPHAIEDLTNPKQKEEYKKTEHYYFIQIFKFARAYEKIFRQLWEKEKHLEKELKKSSKKID